jgi:hypothetical protein
MFDREEQALVDLNSLISNSAVNKELGNGNWVLEASNVFYVKSQYVDLSA